MGRRDGAWSAGDRIVVGIDRVGEGCADPVGPERQVVVPWQEQPLAGAFGVAVEVVVFVGVVVLVGEDGADEIVECRGQVDIVHQVVVQRGAREPVDIADEACEIGVALELACFFREAVSAGERVEALVKRAVGVEPFTDEEVFIDLFDECGDGKEVAVLLDAPERRFGAGRAEQVVDFKG